MSPLLELRALMLLSQQGTSKEALELWVAENYGHPRSLDQARLRAIVVDLGRFLAHPYTAHDCEFTQATVRLHGIFARLARVPISVTISLGGPAQGEAAVVERPQTSTGAEAEPGDAGGWHWRSIVTDEHVPRENLIDVGSLLADALGHLVDFAGADALVALPFVFDDSHRPAPTPPLFAGAELAEPITAEVVVEE